MPEPIAYLDGRIVPFSQAALPVTDGGFLLGTTVAEQLRTFGGRVFRLEQHLGRLRRSLEIVRVTLPVSGDELTNIATEIVRHNHALLAPGDDLGLTVFVTPGTYGTYLAVGETSRPLVGVHTYPLPFRQFAAKYEQGDALVVTDVRQIPETCWPAELKCRSRMHYYLADQAARNLDPGARALLLDPAGWVTESSTANVFAYWQQEGLISPPREHILPGISAAMLRDLARELSIPVTDRPLRPEELAAADEILMCSTSPCVWSVTRFQRQPVGNGKPGPIVQQLLAAWGRQVGVDIAAQARAFAHR